MSDYETSDSMIDIFFEVWFEEYRKQHSENVDQFKDVLRRAFRDGWYINNGGSINANHD